MKKILIYPMILVLFVASSLNAQWTRTNLTGSGFSLIESFCEHNGALYASEKDLGLMKLNEATNNWEEVSSTFNQGSIPTRIANLLSSGNYLYAYVNNSSCGSTMVYKSNDNGATFVADTAGLPHVGGQASSNCVGLPRDVAEAFEIEGKLFNEMSGGFYSKYPEDKEWVGETNSVVKFAENFGSYKGKFYAYAPFSFFTSNDNGMTWNSPVNANLPSQFQVKAMNVNPITGRIYISGTALSVNKCKLLYSDNEGASWDSLAINQYLSSYYLGGPQFITHLISKGNNITARLLNDAANSHPDIIKSTDGGLTFTPDTVGLFIDKYGPIAPVNMLYHNDYLYLALDYNQDIFKQKGGVTSVNEVSKTNIQVYPNPIRHSLTIKSDYPITSIQVTNTLGVLIKNESSLTKTHLIDFNNIPNGIYFVRISSNNKTEVRKILKE